VLCSTGDASLCSLRRNTRSIPAARLPALPGQTSRCGQSSKCSLICWDQLQAHVVAVWPFDSLICHLLLGFPRIAHKVGGPNGSIDSKSSLSRPTWVREELSRPRVFLVQFRCRTGSPAPEESWLSNYSIPLGLTPCLGKPRPRCHPTPIRQHTWNLPLRQDPSSLFQSLARPSENDDSGATLYSKRLGSGILVPSSLFGREAEQKGATRRNGSGLRVWELRAFLIQSVRTRAAPVGLWARLRCATCNTLRQSARRLAGTQDKACERLF
jgi:hypothetical protein